MTDEHTKEKKENSWTNKEKEQTDKKCRTERSKEQISNILKTYQKGSKKGKDRLTKRQRDKHK